MNQTISISGFAAGLTTFIGISGEMVNEHTRWSDFTATPLGALHLVILGAAFVLMIAGALGVQLPRSNHSHGDRAGDHAETQRSSE